MKSVLVYIGTSPKTVGSEEVACQTLNVFIWKTVSGIG
jgi:hypothetical protein